MRLRNRPSVNSPVVVHGGRPDPVGRARRLAAELAPVIEIMDRTGLAAEGFRISGDAEFILDCRYQVAAALAERLESARKVIRTEAENTIGLHALPQALLLLRTAAVYLYRAADEEFCGVLPDGFETPLYPPQPWR